MEFLKRAKHEYDRLSKIKATRELTEREVQSFLSLRVTLIGNGVLPINEFERG